MQSTDASLSFPKALALHKCAETQECLLQGILGSRTPSPGSLGCTWPALLAAVPSVGFAVLTGAGRAAGVRPAPVFSLDGQGWLGDAGYAQGRQRGTWRARGAGTLKTACFFQLLAA